MFKLAFEDGRTVFRQPEDIVEVFDFVRTPKKGQERNWEEITCEELYRRGTLKNPKLYFKLGSDESNDKINHLIEPYVMGALLGDGSIGNYAVTINKPYPDFISRFSDLLPAGYKLTKQSDIIHLIAREDDSLITFEKLLAKCGMYKSLANGKMIPNAYFKGTHEQRLELLKGLLDTDGGSSTDKTVSFYSSSPFLAMGVQHLVWSLGGIAKLVKGTREGKHFNGVYRPIQPEYRVGIKYPKPWELFTIEHKVKNLLEPSRFSKNPKIKLIKIDQEINIEGGHYFDSPFIGSTHGKEQIQAKE